MAKAPVRQPAGNKLRVHLDPVSFPRTIRPDVRAMNTSARAGKVYPAAFIPIMPEDQLLTSRASFVVRMEETEKMLANAVHIRAHAFFVSYAALDRFDGLDSVAYAWAQRVGAPDIVEKYAYVPATHDEFYHAFGEHVASGENVNSLYVEAYNQVVNYRRRQVSISLPERLVTDHTLARALWGETAIARIVPDFDAALIESEVALNLAGGQATMTGTGQVTGLYTEAATSVGKTAINPDGTVGTNVTANHSPLFVRRVSTSGNSALSPNVAVTFDNVVAELAATGITTSLANIELAKKTQAFATIRQQYAGNEDDLIDLLMRGIRFPNNAFREPIHIGTGKATFGLAQRYATDAANLDQYVANGLARVDIPLRFPQQPTGGVVVITYEIVPEPVFDRQADLFLRDTFDDLPNALRDHLDTQPVEIVPNRFVDALHTSPDGTFGYAPLNYEWARRRVAVGGRFLRTLASSPSDEDQQHIWSVRTVDPVLNEDAFLCPADLSHNVFRDTLLDPFLVQAVHNATIEGITQFGPSLYESKGDYDAVAAVVPSATIDPDAV